MNTTNLKLIADYIRTVPQEEFDMRKLDACVIGHTFKNFTGEIVDEHYNIIHWFDSYIEHNRRNESERGARLYMVATMWAGVDNTPEGAVKRIEHVIQWLESPSRDEDYFLNILKETFPGYYNL